MTGWRVEREQRAAYRPAPTPDGGSPHMPPPSQGAERRAEPRAGRTGSRWALRALVIGGLAGAAWLLTGAAAHAADRGDEPAGSLLGVVFAGAEDGVDGLLEAALQPLESERTPDAKHHQNAVQTILSVPTRALDEITHGEPGTAEDPADTVLREVTAPLRTSSEPADAPARRVADEATTDSAAPLVPAEVLPRHEPATSEPPAPTVTAPERPVVDRSQPPAAPRARAVRDHQHRIHASRAGHTASRAGHTPERERAAHRHTPAVRPAASGAVQEHQPSGGDGPAPLQMNLAAMNGGSSASGSGASADAGSAALLPSGIAYDTTPYRLPVAADVDVRRYDAAAPTVSPD